MNFDQKAVKFLANFYINGGKYWTHGPLRQKRPEAALLSWGADEMRPVSRKRAPVGRKSDVGSPGACPPACTRTLRGLLLEQRPPLQADPDVPGPAEYTPRAFVRESSSHPHYSTGCRYPGPDGGGRRAWHSAWLQSESPFTHKVDFNGERQWPSPADHVQSTPPPAPLSASESVHARLRFASGASVRHPWRRVPRASPASSGRAPTPTTSAPACTPAPAAYYVEDCYDSRFPSVPGVVIQGVRRPKRHDTGPFCAL